MKKRTLAIIIIPIILLFGMYKFARMLSPGSYPFAEEYELNYSEAEVKMAIHKLKEKYPEYKTPKVSIENQNSFALPDHQTENPSYWYIAYFYMKKENSIFYTYTRSNGKNKTTFAFVSINNSLNIGNWKIINDDFGYFENRKLKKQFEENILAKLKLILQNLGSS